MFRFNNLLCHSELGPIYKSSYKLLILIGFIGFLALSNSFAGAAQPLKKTLRFGILPDSEKSSIYRRLNPLMQYLQEETGIKTELVIPKDYQELLVQFKEKSIDIAYFGGYTFIKAQQESGAEALVMRDIDLRFSSVFLVRAESDKKNIEDFKGSTLSFGSRLSTSGHLMPRYFLSEHEIKPEEFFTKVLYSGSHDKTAYWVRDGKVDLGAANSSVVRKMFKDGDLQDMDLRVLWETPFYTDYVWAVQPDLDASIKAKLMDSFLALSPVNSRHKKILDAQSAGAYLPVNKADFSALKKIMRLMEQEQE